MLHLIKSLLRATARAADPWWFSMEEGEETTRRLREDMVNLEISVLYVNLFRPYEVIPEYVRGLT